MHATLFGVYETAKDLGMKSLPPTASIVSLKHPQQQTRALETSQTADGGSGNSTGVGGNADDTGNRVATTTATTTNCTITISVLFNTSLYSPLTFPLLHFSYHDNMSPSMTIVDVDFDLDDLI